MADPGSCPIDSAPGASAVAGRARAALRAAMMFFCSVAAATAEQPFDAMFAQREIFLEAIAREQATVPPDLRVTGISVPHHLLAADLMARGFWAAAGDRYDRIILLSPDHFNRSGRPLATTRRDFDTVFGLLENDRAGSARLAGSERPVRRLRPVRKGARHRGAAALHQALLRWRQGRPDRDLRTFDARGLGSCRCDAAESDRTARPRHSIHRLFPLPAAERGGAAGSGNAQHHCGKRSRLRSSGWSRSSTWIRRRRNTSRCGCRRRP